jgi:hypothetical protein
VTEERLNQAGWVSPSRAIRVGRIHQFLQRRSRVAGRSRNRNVAVRNDEKPFQTESSNPSWFRAWVNHSYPEGNGCYCGSARRERLRRHNPRPSKVAAKRDKVSARDGKHSEFGFIPPCFQNVGDPAKRVPLAREQEQPES